MKNKTKGLIALIAMTAATAVAAGSSTFAWFQTNRNANLSFNKITIQKRGANELKAEIIKLGGGTLDTDKQSLTVASPDAMAADISSKDGVQLYAPVWGSKVGDNEQVSKVEEVIDANNAHADSWFTEFAFKLTNVKHGDDTTKLNVFLDQTTLLKAVAVDTPENILAAKNLISEYEADHASHTESEYNAAVEKVAKQNANDAAAKWSRVAIVSLNAAPKSDGTVAENHASVGKGKLGQTGVLTFENECKESGSDTKNSSTEYINSTTLTANKMDIKEYVTADRHYYTFANPESYFANAHTAYSDSWGADAKKGFLVALDPDDPDTTDDDANTKYFVVRVWLEGTENDDQEAADKGEVSLNLGFASYGIDA